VSRRLRTGVRLSEIKRAAEEKCLQSSFEGDQRWRRNDVRRQTVPNATCGDCENVVADELVERAAQALKRLIKIGYCENKASFGSYLSLTFLRKLAKLSKTVHVLYVKVIASERLNGGTM